MPAISFQSVSKVYPALGRPGSSPLKALDNVSFDIEHGEFFGLPGHVRIGFGGDAEQLDRALGRFADALRRYRPS